MHFDHAYLRRTALEGARLWGASFVGADLTEAQLGSTADTDSLGGQLKEFPAADLSGANLSDATLTNAYMYDLDMSPLEPNTSDPGALRDEGRTNLSDANLQYAYMIKANLRDAILNGADFTCANLAGADFTGATGIEWKQLENEAENLSEAIKPDGTTYVQQQPTLRWYSEEFEPAMSFNFSEASWLPTRETTDGLSIVDLEGNELTFSNPLRAVDPSNLSDPKEVPAPESAE